MAKKKLGISSFDLNKQFKDRNEAYTYAKRLREYIRSICKKNAVNGWSAQAMICISNTRGNTLYQYYEHTGKVGRPRKVKDFSDFNLKYYNGNMNVDWHLHILLVSKPSYAFRDEIKSYIYRNWKDSSISVILNNKRYIGIHEHRKSSKNKETIEIAGKIPPIISEDDFYQCQENIKRNMRNYYRNKNYLFMQKLVCPKCGRTLACNGAKNSEGKTYLYYKCKDCDTYVREELVEQALVDKLNNLLELNNIISDDYVPIDKDLAEDFNNCRLNHKMRFAIDERIINDKLKCDGCVELNDIWKLSSYEAKCKFIYEYIDEITVKKFNSKNKKINNVEMLDLKLKGSKIEKLFELSEKGLIDEMFSKGEYKFSKADMKRESDALEYIDLLKKKHNISTIELPLEDYDFYWDPSFFKVINIRPVKAIEKRKAIYLYLNDYYEKVL